MKIVKMGEVPAPQGTMIKRYQQLPSGKMGKNIGFKVV